MIRLIVLLFKSHWRYAEWSVVGMILTREIYVSKVAHIVCTE